MNLVIIYFAIKYKGYFHDIYQAIKQKEEINFEDLLSIKKMLETNEIKAITIVDDDYPESLKLINNPPFVLFYKGNKELLKNEILLVTGDFSNENIEKFTSESLIEINKNHTLISNNNKGFDEQIINHCLKEKCKIIFVSPNGLNNPYFGKQIQDEVDFDFQNHLIISEFPNDVNLNHRRLIQRNRVTIGLSKALIIASSYKKSKINSLVSLALEQGKDIFCFPGIQNEEDGNNLLIQDGATMITSIKNKI